MDYSFNYLYQVMLRLHIDLQIKIKSGLVFFATNRYP